MHEEGINRWCSKAKISIQKISTLRQFIMAMKSLYLECHWLMPYALDFGKGEVTKYTLDFDTKWCSAFSI